MSAVGTVAAKSTAALRLSTRVCIVGSGPAGHTAAIYAARTLLSPIMLEGWMANGVASGGQLTTTTEVENFPGFTSIFGGELMDRMREQSSKCGTRIISETVAAVDLSRRPFKIFTEQEKTVVEEADTLIVATGAVAKRLHFPGADALWNKGISACAVCDGAAPIFRGKPLAVVGGGDTAMEEANFLSKYGSQVFVVHRRDQFRASKVMQDRVFKNPKIKVIWDSVVEGASASERGLLGEIALRNVKTGAATALQVSGLFFAIGHEPASKFLSGQVELDADGYVVTKPGTPETSVPGVFAGGDVQDKHWRQAVTAAGSGCMAALAAAHFLEGIDAGEPAGCQATAPSEVPAW